MKKVLERESREITKGKSYAKTENNVSWISIECMEWWAFRTFSLKKIIIRLLYYLPMERMKHLEKELEKSVWEIIIDLQREIRDLEEENKNLKEKVRFLEECLDNKEKVNKSLREKLKWWKDLVHKAKEFEYDEDGMDYIWQNTKI